MSLLRATQNVDLFACVVSMQHCRRRYFNVSNRSEVMIKCWLEQCIDSEDISGSPLKCCLEQLYPTGGGEQLEENPCVVQHPK